MSTEHGGRRFVVEATIANGQSESSAVPLDNGALVGLFLPTAWTAAAITFLVEDPGGTYRPARDAYGSELSVTGFTAGDYIVFPAGSFHGIRNLKVRSGVAGSAVNQGAARTFKAIIRGFE